VWHRPVGSNAVGCSSRDDAVIHYIAAYIAAVIHNAFQWAKQPPKIAPSPSWIWTPMQYMVLSTLPHNKEYFCSIIYRKQSRCIDRPIYWEAYFPLLTAPHGFPYYGTTAIMSMPFSWSWATGSQTIFVTALYQIGLGRWCRRSWWTKSQEKQLRPSSGTAVYPHMPILRPHATHVTSLSD